MLSDRADARVTYLVGPYTPTVYSYFPGLSP